MQMHENDVTEGIGLHTNLFSPMWNPVHGTVPDAGFVGNANHSFSGVSSFGQLLSYATAGALYHAPNEFNGSDRHGPIYLTNPEDEVQQGDGYEAGEDSGFESDSTSDGYEREAEVQEEESDDDVIVCQNDNSNQRAYDGCYVAAVDDDIPIKKFQNRGFAVESDDDHHGTDDTVFLDDDVQVLDDTLFLDDDIQVLDDTSKNNEVHMDDAEGGSAEVGDETDQAHVAEANVGMEDTSLPTEETSPCLLGDCGCAKHELAQEISENYIQSMKAGYKKRNRTQNGLDCRKPRDMGAIEIAMRLAGKRKTEHIFEPVLAMVFDSKEEAYEFYNMYSWESGFGVVYSRCVRRQSDKEYRSMQELRCERSDDVKEY